MKTYHWNGEYWYERRWSLFHHIRHWLIWIGGWEKANGEGWHLTQVFNKRKLRSPTPVALFGGRFTHYGWGWNIRFRKTYFVWSRSGRPLHIYLSPDGTPGRATTWIKGVPYEIYMNARLLHKERVKDNDHTQIG